MGIKWKEDYSVETQRWFGIAIGFVCGLLCLALFAFLRGYDISWPAWIQAIGSVGAILVAVKVADRQLPISRQLQKEEFELLAQERKQTRIDSLRAIEMTAETAGRAAKRACLEILKMDINCWDDLRVLCSKKRPSLEVANEVLKKLPVQDFPGVLIGRHVLNMRVAFDRLLGLFDHLNTSNKLDWDEVLSEVESIKSQLVRHLRHMDGFMQAYDGTLGILRASDF